MKRRLLLIALAISPAMGLADSFSSRGAGERRRQRELTEKFREQKNTMQKQQKENPEVKNNKTNKTDVDDRNNPGD